ncbi:TetR family transcriptional regulator [Streptomyces longispororuber]|uniref:TetR family transcriptional regulator n=1 Tax=Streptomyces longispororuber TaxID=68230 RepID=A0A919A7G8_9ACTN|nr:ScbR family autoregulator-binding transcription factor [Streptomyces longispororuber]GHE90024.1 TetR family transcriptional regulator [Streptomyces longispororuber]
MVQQARAARTRQLLMRAAAQTFAEEGFQAASLSTISRRAQVSSGALHFHFESKHVLAQAVEEVAADALARITRQAGRAPVSRLQRLVDATHQLMSALEEDVVVRAGFELAGTTPRRGEAVDLRGRWQCWVEDLLHAAAADGELAPDVAPTEASMAVLAATVGFEVLGSANPKWVSRTTVNHYWELMLPRLAPPHALPALTPYGTTRTTPHPDTTPHPGADPHPDTAAGSGPEAGPCRCRETD